MKSLTYIQFHRQDPIKIQEDVKTFINKIYENKRKGFDFVEITEIQCLTSGNEWDEQIEYVAVKKHINFNFITYFKSLA